MIVETIHDVKSTFIYETDQSFFVCFFLISLSFSSSLSSSFSFSSSLLSFGFPSILFHGMFVKTIITKNPAIPNVAIEVTISRGWDVPDFNLALVTDIHSLNFGSKKVLSLQRLSLQKHV